MVLELQQVGEAQAGLRLGQARIGRREAGKLGVRGRKDDDLARGLAEIDRLRAVGDDAGLCGEEMHQPCTAASIAARSSPLRPMTTNRLRRASSAAQARS